MILNTEILGNKAKPARLAGPCEQKIPRQRRRWAIAICLATSAVSANLAACGQKGPLYPPAPTSSPSSSTPSK
ncbi:MAG: hypothetical protein EPO09_04210 [Aquabacterium sp.]|uniref:LPS translocon maturation chaperone LptM n=1 Tax=Aquabacterium sp. TaxID=1872578 RepID=UPI00121EBF4F|nr:lipoprotein [Aquabacterium sp.]TAK97357.1 MAG: hypothetical protein EPO09_04210 [Aquabacterium sp.]